MLVPVFSKPKVICVALSGFDPLRCLTFAASFLPFVVGLAFPFASVGKAGSASSAAASSVGATSLRASPGISGASPSVPSGVTMIE